MPGAWNGEAPTCVAWRPTSCRRRGSVRWSAANAASVRLPSSAPRSTGGRNRRRPGTPPGRGPARCRRGHRPPQPFGRRRELLPLGRCAGTEPFERSAPLGLVVGNVEGRSVGPVAAHLRVERDELDLVGECRARGSEHLVPRAREREHRRPEVETEAGELERRHLAAHHGAAFEHDHLVPGGGQPDSDGEPADAGADHHRLHRVISEVGRRPGIARACPIGGGASGFRPV